MPIRVLTVVLAGAVSLAACGSSSGSRPADQPSASTTAMVDTSEAMKESPTSAMVATSEAMSDSSTTAP